jgi:aldehyde:ferredoxin oxidoreductase
MILPKYIKINLSTGEIEEVLISEELYRNYLGGKTLGARLLYDLQPKGVEPLSPDSVLIINTGPMNGTGAPSSSRFNLTFKNVMTGGIASSNCGGQFGVMLKKAGYDGIIITGAAEKPTAIEIIDGEVKLVNAEHLWGMDAEKVQEEFDHSYGKLVIGPAGENLVRYACAVSGERVAGRCGAGAVMGSKKIKAIVAYGTKRAEVHNKEAFNTHVKKWVKFLKSHPMTGTTLGRYGTAGLVNTANASSALPTHNFKAGHYEKAEAISGEELADKHLVRNSGCISCPIRCERRVMVGGKEVKGPEYETVGLFGSNIENSDLEIINEINYQSDILGLDTISLGGTLAFAMELQERGLADFGLQFGKTDNILEIIRKIAYCEGKYAELALGSKELSKIYGGEEYAIHAKGLELAAYEPRRSVGMGLGYATSNRGGCHLNGGYLALIESVGVISVDSQTHKGKPELTVFFQNMMEAVSSAGFCLFTAQAVIPAVFFKLGPLHWLTRFANKAFLGARFLLRHVWKLMPWILPINSIYLLPQSQAIEYATGIKMTSGKLLQIGERGFNMERMFNLREGLTYEDDTLPERMTKVRQVESMEDSVVCLDKMLPRYYSVRGWDDRGVPTQKKLKKLGLPYFEVGL